MAATSPHEYTGDTHANYKAMDCCCACYTRIFLLGGEGDPREASIVAGAAVTNNTNIETQLLLLLLSRAISNG